MSRLTEHLEETKEEGTPADPLPAELPEGDPSEVEDEDSGN
jgi:hypothetical protein